MTGGAGQGHSPEEPYTGKEYGEMELENRRLVSCSREGGAESGWQGNQGSRGRTGHQGLRDTRLPPL